jgi:hypothetical protein
VQPGRGVSKRCLAVLAKESGLPEREKGAGLVQRYVMDGLTPIILDHAMVAAAVRAVSIFREWIRDEELDEMLPFLDVIDDDVGW